MIITRTPYRVSLFGGGTDYPAWYAEHGGQVLTCSLPKYTYISLRRMPAFLGTRYRVFWSKMETCNEIEEIEHPGVRGCLEYLGVEDGIEVNHAGDLPARSGLGSSSAFTVGMLNALHAMMGEYVGPMQLAKEAIEVEQEVLKETVGIQDQIECAHGGFNHIHILPSGDYAIRQMVGDHSALESHLMLFFTGIQRHASKIASTYAQANSSAELTQIERLVMEAIPALKDPPKLGALLHQAWVLKRSLSDDVSNTDIDALYDKACTAGAIGGKILGAGGGGFLLLLVEPEAQRRVRAALDLIEVPFAFGSQGSQVVHYDP